MWFIKATAVGLITATVICLIYLVLDNLKEALGITVYAKSYMDLFVGALAGAATLYTWMTED